MDCRGKISALEGQKKYAKDIAEKYKAELDAIFKKEQDKQDEIN